MKDVIIYGAGGFGREVHVLIKQINRIKLTYNIIGFVDDNPALKGLVINGVDVLGGFLYLESFDRPVSVAFAVLVKKKPSIVEKLLQNVNLSFDNFIHPAIYWDETNNIGQGNILCHGMNITCNVSIGSFNVFNGKVGIGHDVQIGNYNLFGPNAFIAGEVLIGDSNVFAMNSSVLQQKSIGNRNTVNMNSVVIRNIIDDGIYFGVPAMKQTF